METARELYYIWQNYPYRNKISFLIFIPLFFVLRSIILKRLNLLFNSKFEHNELSPFLQSLINWSSLVAFSYRISSKLKRQVRNNRKGDTPLAEECPRLNIPNLVEGQRLPGYSVWGESI